MIDWVTLAGYLITPITGLVGWFAGTKMRRNSALQSLRETIQLQAETIKEYNQQNIQLLNEMQEVRRENAELKAGQDNLLLQVEVLKRENKELKDMLKSK